MSDRTRLSGKYKYSGILLRAHEVRAHVENGHNRQARRCAEALLPQLRALIDREYNCPPPVLHDADPVTLVSNMIAHGESAHPLSMEAVLMDLISLLDRVIADGEEASRETASTAEELVP